MSKNGKTRIIEAAQRVIGRNGIFGATVRGIAEEANMSTGAIYHYYKSKEEILYDVMDQSLSMSSKILQETETGLLDTDELFEEIYRNIMKRFEKSDENKLQFYLSHEAMLGNEELKEKFKEKYNTWISSIEVLMGKLYNKPTSRLNNAFISILLAGIDGILLQILLEANTASKKELSEVYRLLLLEGVPKFQDFLYSQGKSK